MYKQSIMLVLFLSLFAAACRESFYELPEENPTAADVASAETLAEPLRFDLLTSPCIMQGTTISTSIVHPGNQERFEVEWFVDGAPAQKGPQIDCVCGRLVTANVVRLADGARGSQSIKLPECPDEVDE